MMQTEQDMALDRPAVTQMGLDELLTAIPHSRRPMTQYSLFPLRNCLLTYGWDPTSLVSLYRIPGALHIIDGNARIAALHDVCADPIVRAQFAAVRFNVRIYDFGPTGPTAAQRDELVADINHYESFVPNFAARRL